jgi:hypothetical protein
MSADMPGTPAEPEPSFPALSDAGGYQLQQRDAVFIGVAIESLHAVIARAYPLGFSSAEDWQLCCDELRAALQADGLSDADVRLKGTAASFFSHNPDKPFPQSGTDCRSQAETNRLDGAAAETQWNGSPYAKVSALPNRCFWDCRQRLGIDSAPSDYDIQISSEALRETMGVLYPDGMYRGRPVVSEHGGHFTHGVLLRTFGALATWSAEWQSRLGRQVNLAGFSASGPSNDISRFSDDDWVIIS